MRTHAHAWVNAQVGRIYAKRRAVGTYTACRPLRVPPMGTAPKDAQYTRNTLTREAAYH